MRFFLFIVLLWILPQTANAQTPSDCQSIVVRDARLGCYDKLFPPIKPQFNSFPDDSGKQKGDVSAPVDKKTLDYSWANVVGCKRISKAPAFKFSNVPANAHTVSLVLTKGDREFGGQEVVLPESGLIPEGLITMEGPCSPGMYRWTATIKSVTGVILATLRADRWFPAD